MIQFIFSIVKRKRYKKITVALQSVLGIYQVTVNAMTLRKLYKWIDFPEN